MIHVVYSGGPNLTYEQKENMLDKLVDLAMKESLALTRARYLTREEMYLPEPSIRISVNQELCKEEIDGAIQIIKQIVRSLPVPC